MKRSAVVRCIVDTKKATCLPAEVLLNIVHCLDFNTLVALCFTSHSFHSVVQANAGVLAKRRGMWLKIEDDKVILCDGDTDLELSCDPSMHFTYVAAMKRVASHVGCHSIAALNVTNDWRRLPMDRLFYVSAALRFVETLLVNVGAWNSTSFKSVDDVNHFAARFPRLRRVHLYTIGRSNFHWCAFLRSESARQMPELVVDGPIYPIRSTDGSTSEPKEYDFLRYCFDWSLLAEGVGKVVKLPHVFPVTRSFLVTALRRIAIADRTVTVQFRLAQEPDLSTDKFSVHQLQQYGLTITHYKSRSSSVSVYDLNGFVSVTNDPQGRS